MRGFAMCMLFVLPLFFVTCKNTAQPGVLAAVKTDSLAQDSFPAWMIGSFVKADSLNPCLIPSPVNTFRCPVRNEFVHWEAKDVFNPAVIVRNGVLHMLYRAEDSIGRFAGTSRLGLALSTDGLHFERQPAPVFFPDRDQMFQYEWEGGCEDPRIVRRADGLYVMTYTAYDGHLARLCVASSRDLKSWTKHGLALSDGSDKYADLWSKSGAIVARYDTNGVMTARMINGKYWMYWGDKHIHLATSRDLIKWTPLLDEHGSIKSILSPRPRMFDSDLVEPGPAAMINEDGILLLYNGRNFGETRDTLIAEGTYSAGQVLFNSSDPTKMIDRSVQPFLIPERPYEISGQINRVVFIEGLVQWKKRWWLYYGTADSRIAVAVAR